MLSILKMYFHIDPFQPKIISSKYLLIFMKLSLLSQMHHCMKKLPHVFSKIHWLWLNLKKFIWNPIFKNSQKLYQYFMYVLIHSFNLILHQCKIDPYLYHSSCQTMKGEKTLMSCWIETIFSLSFACFLQHLYQSHEKGTIDITFKMLFFFAFTSQWKKSKEFALKPNSHFISI